VGIEACPPIEQGPGQVVLTTVNHLNKYVFDLTVADQRGRRETIGVTGFHKIYSKSRQAWVSASELHPGENLVGIDGSTISVVEAIKRPTTHRVYNMTVETEHVYHVSSFGILVHNNDCRDFAEAFVDQNGGGIVTVRPLPNRPGHPSDWLPADPPGYPVIGQPDPPFGEHVIAINDGMVFDPAHPNGISIEGWLEAWGQNYRPTSVSGNQVFNELSFLPDFRRK
jgi:hypothetical protein